MKKNAKRGLLYYCANEEADDERLQGAARLRSLLIIGPKKAAPDKIPAVSKPTASYIEALVKKSINWPSSRSMTVYIRIGR